MSSNPNPDQLGPPPSGFALPPLNFDGDLDLGPPPSGFTPPPETPVGAPPGSSASFGLGLGPPPSEWTPPPLNFDGGLDLGPPPSGFTPPPETPVGAPPGSSVSFGLGLPSALDSQLADDDSSGSDFGLPVPDFGAPLDLGALLATGGDSLGDSLGLPPMDLGAPPADLGAPLASSEDPLKLDADFGAPPDLGALLATGDDSLGDHLDLGLPPMDLGLPPMDLGAPPVSGEDPLKLDANLAAPSDPGALLATGDVSLDLDLSAPPADLGASLVSSGDPLDLDGSLDLGLPPMDLGGEIVIPEAPKRVIYSDVSEEIFNLPEKKSLNDFLVTPPTASEEEEKEKVEEEEEKEKVEEEEEKEKVDEEEGKIEEEEKEEKDALKPEKEMLCREWEFFIAGEKPLINCNTWEYIPKTLEPSPSSEFPGFGAYTLPSILSSITHKRTKAVDLWFGEVNNKCLEAGETRSRSLHVQLEDLRGRAKDAIGQEYYEKLEKELGGSWREAEKEEEEERKRQEEEKRIELEKDEERKRLAEEEEKKRLAEEEEKKRLVEEEEKIHQQAEKERTKKEEEQKREEEQKKDQGPSEMKGINECLDKIKASFKEFVGVIKVYSTAQDLKSLIDLCESFKEHIMALIERVRKISPQKAQSLQELFVVFWKNVMTLAHVTNQHQKAGKPPAGKETEVAAVKGSIFGLMKCVKSVSELQSSSSSQKSPSSSTSDFSPHHSPQSHSPIRRPSSPNTSSSSYSPNTSSSSYSPVTSSSAHSPKMSSSLNLPSSSSSSYSPNLSTSCYSPSSSPMSSPLSLPKAQIRQTYSPSTAPMSPLVTGGSSSEYSLPPPVTQNAPSGLKLQGLNAVDQTILITESNPAETPTEIRNITNIVKQIIAQNLVPAELKQPIISFLKAIIEKTNALKAQPQSRLAKMHVIQQLKNLKNLLNQCQ